jgi:hypothetical protein
VQLFQQQKVLRTGGRGNYGRAREKGRSVINLFLERLIYLDYIYWILLSYLQGFKGAEMSPFFMQQKKTFIFFRLSIAVSK